MRYLEIYNPSKTYIYPNGQIATPEDIQVNYSMVTVGTCVVETDKSHLKFYSIDLLTEMMDRLGVDDELSEADAIIAMEEVLNAPQPEPEPSAEERIAAAMEYQNLFI